MRGFAENDGGRRRMLTSMIQTRVIDFQRNKVEDGRAIAYIGALILQPPAKTPGVWILQTAISIKDRAMHCDKRGYGRTHAVYNAILSTERGIREVRIREVWNARKRNHNTMAGEQLLHFCARRRIENDYLSNIFFHNRRNNRRPRRFQGVKVKQFLFLITR